MHNQVTLHADRVLRTYSPELADQVKHLAVVNATNEKNLWAIDNMLAIIENSRSFGVRKRPLRKATVNCLLRLADVTISRINRGFKDFTVKRIEFANLIGNDYNILRYWGFIAPGKAKGAWLLTQLGVKFICGKILVPDAVTCHGGSHTRNYSFDEGYNMVEIDDYFYVGLVPSTGRNPREEYQELLKKAQDPNNPIQLPLGEPLPTITIKEK